MPSDPRPAAPDPTTDSPQTQKDDYEPNVKAFIEWFLVNYPQGTVIERPEWHAPKIFRVAHSRMPAPEVPPAAAPDVPAEEPSAEQVEAWVLGIKAAADFLRTTNLLKSPEERQLQNIAVAEFEELATLLPLLIQRAHDADARASDVIRDMALYRDQHRKDQDRVVLAQAALRDAEQRIATLTSERSALRGKIEALEHEGYCRASFARNGGCSCLKGAVLAQLSEDQ